MVLKISTIPESRAFLPELAKGIFEMAGGFGPDLTQFRILLPTRRAARELRETFLNLAGDKPLLLPRINPLGDVNQEELELMLSGTLGIENFEVLPQALSSFERQMILTRLIQTAYPDKRGEQCLALARALGVMMDQVYAEDLDLAQLPQAVEIAELAAHWSQTVEFLKILSEAWPQILTEKGVIDAADRRNRLLKMLAYYWQSNPPATSVIIAGAVGTTPASRQLIKVVAGLPIGRVILPGLDQDMDDESWTNISETHPQNLMKRLLTSLEMDRNQVKIWREARVPYNPRTALSQAMTCPAKTCDTFKFEKADIERGLDNVHLIEAENPRHEAQLISIAIREVLENKDKTIIVVTPDRNLSRRISAALRRWDIRVDDSAGQPLHMRPIGIFFNRIVNCVIEDLSPVALLDLLKSPFLSDDYTNVSDFETAIMRGSRPAPGFKGLHNRIEKVIDADKKDACFSLAKKLETALAPLFNLNYNHSFDEFLQALVTAGEALAGGKDKLWKAQDGHDLSGLISRLEDIAGNLPPADLWTSRGYLLQFMSDCMIRPAYGTHPRVTILGLIEARLLHADVMIIAGLNEGTWPLEPDADPWMSRPMRSRFGLPPKARETGISAHDFTQGFSADTVILSRSKRVDGAQTSRSRWLQCLEALLKPAGLGMNYLTRKSDNEWAEWLNQLDMTEEFTPVEAPQPRPPVSLRPKTLSVTQIETLMKNPYRIYADKILKLRPLPPIDEDVTASERGSFVHDILNQFIANHTDHLPENSQELLLDLGRSKLDELEQVSPLWHYWWPRFERMSGAFLDTEKKWRLDARPQQQEIKGSFEFKTSAQNFTLTGRADRIDRIKAGGAAIIDYKTGNKPTLSNIACGKAPQLPLEALLITKGGFANINADKDNINLSYWVLTGKDTSPVERYDLDNRKTFTLPDLITDAEDGLISLMTAFYSEATPLTATIPTSAYLYDDDKAYKHLARCDEWGISGDAEPAEDAAA